MIPADLILVLHFSLANRPLGLCNYVLNRTPNDKKVIIKDLFL